MHTDDRQYNTLIDLIIDFSNKVQEQYKNILGLIKTIEELQNKHTKVLEKIEKNLDFIKDQEVEISNKLKSSNKVTCEDAQLIKMKNQVERISGEVNEIKKIILKIEKITLL